MQAHKKLEVGATRAQFDSNMTRNHKVINTGGDNIVGQGRRASSSMGPGSRAIHGAAKGALCRAPCLAWLGFLGEGGFLRPSFGHLSGLGVAHLTGISSDPGPPWISSGEGQVGWLRLVIATGCMFAPPPPSPPTTPLHLSSCAYFGPWGQCSWVHGSTHCLTASARAEWPPHGRCH